MGVGSPFWKAPMSQPSPITNTAPRVTAAIASAAARTGTDFTYLMQQARIESGMNPDARARTSSASGLFQFTRQTWLATVKAHGADHGLGWAAGAIERSPSGRYHVADPAQRAAIQNLRFQPEAASAMAAEFASDNGAYLNERLGRAPEPVDLYLAHFLGAAGAERFLNAHDANPDAPAAPLMPHAAAANRPIFYRADGSAHSLADIRERFAAKLNAAPPANAVPVSGPKPMTIAIANSAAPREFPTLRTIEPMPQRLSLDFARSAYHRLAALDGGSFR